ncbi:E3 ubiquitin-protein ligase RAD18-like isoform X3 [Halichondria panicea]|uniref:E3 ubiquitin-protein ligase RAD18-like isoform X3 n=1 Tax=Halichondria panicea TaxID=6063 RepID=UPI00312B860C
MLTVHFVQVVNESELRINRQLDLLVQTFNTNRHNFLDLLSSRATCTCRNPGPQEDLYRVPLPPAMSQLPDFDEESQFQNDWIPPTVAIETSTPPTCTILETCNEISSAKLVQDEEDCYGGPIARSKGTIENSLNHNLSSDVHEGNPSTSFLSSIQQVSAASPSVAVNPLSIGDPTGSATPSQAAVKNVPCPVCSQLVSETFINSHLDSCLNRSLIQKPPTPTCSSQHKACYKLPNLVFAPMKDRELRKKLKTYGLSHQGQRHALIDRLREFTLHYNAQCDSSNPKTMSKVATEVEKAEKSRAIASKSGTSQVARRRSTADPTEIEQQNKAHVKAHADQFNQLIARARKSRNKASSNTTHSPLNADDTIQSNLSTPPLSPVAPLTLVTPPFANATPTSKATSALKDTPTMKSTYQAGMTSSHENHLSTQNENAHSRGWSAIEQLYTPIPRHRTTPIPMTTPIHSVATPHYKHGAPSNGAVPRKLEEDTGFDDLSPLESPHFSKEGSEGSTPELEHAVKGCEVAPESPEGVTKHARGEVSAVPESPVVVVRSLRSQSKRRFRYSKIRYTPLLPEKDDPDFDLSSPKHNKKQRRS